VLSGVATVPADEWPAVVVCGFVASADRLSQGAGQSNCGRLPFWWLGRPSSTNLSSPHLPSL
jgi:hypothetical protein